MVLDYIAKQCNVSIDRMKFKGMTCDTTLNGKRILLLKPMTYMNLSGDSVRAVSYTHLDVYKRQIYYLTRYMTNFISKAFSYFFLNLQIIAPSFFYNFLLLSLIIAIYDSMGELMLLNTK